MSMFTHVKLGIAPIGWTNDDDPSLGGNISFEQCIQEMHDAGYQGCEVGNKFSRNPKQLQAALEPLNLQIASAWFSTYFVIPEKVEQCVADFMVHMNFLKAMGAKVIVVSECGASIQGTPQPIFGKKPVFTEKQWRDLFSGLERIGEYAKKNEMDIVYHEHMGTGVQTEEEVHYLMQHTDPALVSLLIDTGHITYAGGDPVALINEYGQRVKHVHLKDLRQENIDIVRQQQLSFLDGVRLGTFTIPGDGFINFKPIFSALSKQHYQGWFIVEAEQDPKKAPPLEYAKKARSFIKTMTGL